jgi:hypothetical protein
MTDFWLSCGHHLLDRDADGRLRVTEEFLKIYLARPELTPPADACVVERTLHATLLADPWHPVATAQIDAMADADARENWHYMVVLRDHLAAHATLEAAYLALVRDNVRLPPLFLDQLVQLILRNLLDGCDDAFMLRAAELFFRPQRLTLYDDTLLAADLEHIDNHGPSESPLATMLGLQDELGVDVLSDANATGYWERSDRFDLALDLTAERRGVTALGVVVARWVKHLLGTDVEVEALRELRDVALTWYVGLDSFGTKIGDALWNGETIDEARRSHVVGLFRLTVRDKAAVIDRPADEQVYLILAMGPDRVLRVKPQNLLTGLPVRHVEPAT